MGLDVLLLADSTSRWAQAMRVSYRVDNERLLKLFHPLTGPESSSIKTNALAEGVARFNVTLFDGTDWLDAWPPSNSNATPRAARLEIGTKDQKAWKTEVWIPAGTVFTSGLIRTASGLNSKR